MIITLRDATGYEVEIAVENSIVDAGVVMLNCIAYVYESHPRFRQPVFVEQKVYHA